MNNLSNSDLEIQMAMSILSDSPTIFIHPEFDSIVCINGHPIPYDYFMDFISPRRRLNKLFVYPDTSPVIDLWQKIKYKNMDVFIIEMSLTELILNHSGSRKLYDDMTRLHNEEHQRRDRK